MKIWIFNHYASTPDQPMTGAYYLAKSFVDLGHDISVFASSFSYYKLKEIRLKNGKFYREEQFEGIRFIWIRTSPHNSNLWTRSVNMLSYFFMTLFVSLRKRERPDFIIGTCPHLPAVLAAYLVSLIKGSKFIFEVRDMWPQTFLDQGRMSKNNIIVIFLRVLEKFLYKRANLISTVLPFAYEYLEKLGIKKEKTVWIPNGIDVTKYPSVRGNNHLADNSNHVFMYLGGHSSYQGLDTILGAAHLILRENINSVKFILIGDGVDKPRLVQEADRLMLRNVEFRDAVPRSDLFRHMEEASVLIYHSKYMKINQYGMSPNKMCDYLMSGKPILCAVNSRNNPVMEANAGICIAPENPSMMAQAIKQFISMPPKEKKIMGERGLQYALDHYDVRNLARSFEKALQRLVITHKN